MNLALLKSTCQVFCRMSLNLVFLMLSNDYIDVMKTGKNTKEVTFSSHDIVLSIGNVLPGDTNPLCLWSPKSSH